MKYNPDIHHRRSIRLRGYDYSQEGAYFVTICVKDKRHLFGKIENGEMILNELGKIAYHEWEKLPERWPHLELGAFQIMPNHMHGIIIIHNTPVGATLAVAQPPVAQEITTQTPPSHPLPKAPAPIQKRPTQIKWATKPVIGQITGAYKSCVLTEALKWINANDPGKRLGKLWQRNMWEVIIRNLTAFDNISNYIINNPKTWESDKFFTLD